MNTLSLYNMSQVTWKWRVVDRLILAWTHRVPNKAQSNAAHPCSYCPRAALAPQCSVLPLLERMNMALPCLSLHGMPYLTCAAWCRFNPRGWFCDVTTITMASHLRWFVFHPCMYYVVRPCGKLRNPESFNGMSLGLITVCLSCTTTLRWPYPRHGLDKRFKGCVS